MSDLLTISWAKAKALVGLGDEDSKSTADSSGEAEPQSVLAQQTPVATGTAPMDVAPGMVQLKQEFTLQGIPDGLFAERVVAAVQERRMDFEKLLSAIMNDHRRLVYGG